MTTLKYCGHGGLCRRQPDCSDVHCEGRPYDEQAARVRRVMEMPLGVEAALPASFTRAKEPIDWQAVWVYIAVFITFTAVMVLSAYKT